jgi:hypothetical protein
MNNRSLIFGRKDNFWHGVRDIHCPDGAFRKAFIVVFQDVTSQTVFETRQEAAQAAAIDKRK